MRVLLVTDAYPPEVGSAAQLMAELAQELDGRGHAVTVLTSWPAYKLDRSTRSEDFAEHMKDGAVQVLRAKTLPLHNSTFIVRGFAQLFAPYQFWKLLKRYEAEPFDAVMVYSPPLPLFNVGAWAKREGARFVLNVQDIFPQNAIDLGILKNRLAIGLFRWIEHKAYRSADIVTVHSEGNRVQLAAANPDIGGKLVIVHNWIAPDEFAAVERDENFREIFGLQNKFVLVYGGVIGLAQGLEVILEVAARVRDLSDLVFVIVGDGMEKSRLQARAAAEGLANVEFQPFVARERYPSVLRSANVGFLTLSPKMKTPVVPGKILGYMAVALPVLAIINSESDAHQVIAEAECGYSCNSDDIAAAEALVRRLYSERASLADLGRKGHAYAKVNFSKQVIVDYIESFMN